ncbi:Armadillo repeat-containing 8-like protein [Cladobotryum mycophilum]|uniref:Armadillo repeat-containing 8-like protein n=1 Tax=Cladobotryum mycophilum TaxID=491253 RepID=A0ABR0T0I8_9HYPO
MARHQSSPILAQLRNAKTFSEQSDALQALKNEIVGHVQKKEAWLALGVLEPIVLCLSSNRPQAKSNARDVRPQQVARPLSEEDGVRLQALQIIASFANGGPPFLQPLNAAGALPAILTCLSPTINAPQIVVAALKALTDIANASALALPSTPLDIQTLADNIFSSSQHLESFCLVLSTTSPKYLQQSQLSLAAGLICRLCREERHQHALATSGVLDILGTQLASFAVAKGHVVPGAEEQAYSNRLFEMFPEQAHPGAKIGPILEAISTIIGDSKYRATRLDNSPAVLAVFPVIDFCPPESSVAARIQRGKVTAMEYLLPTIPSPVSYSKIRSHHLDPSGRPEADTLRLPPSGSFGFVSPSWDEAHYPNDLLYDGEVIETPLLPWLIVQVRSLTGYDRLMAASVLTALYKAGFGSAIRETSLGLLVVPILVDLIAKNTKDDSDSGPIDTAQRLILERAPAVLARLITDSEYLQNAAFDCGAIKILVKLLKQAYEPVSVHEQPKAWSSQPDTGMDVEESSLSSRLGEGGQNPLLAHRLRVRESALKAIAALGSGKDDYRKDLIAQDFVPYVVESLTEHPSKPRQIKDKSKEKPSSNEVVPHISSPSGYGINPPSVIIAGCHVVRMLARSISILRTSLVDHAVALPIFEFMKHADVNVQIAATATICNLVVEVSPVRELLGENGVMKVLCEHARSENSVLRLNALWALKHFVVAVSPDVKKACLEQLEPGWLVQLIRDDSTDMASYNSRSKQSVGDDLDEEMDAPPSDEPFRWLYVSNGLLRELDASRSSRLRTAEVNLTVIREAELNPVKRARSDNIAIQEQGLDFIRNLIGPGAGPTAESPCETTEMIDYLFSALGQDRFFDILASKLRPKVLNPYSRRSSGGRETKVLHPQAKIIAAVIFILVHVAASIPRYRQLVVAQTELLRLLAQQASSKDKEVRVALCHLVINLTGQEDESEDQACGQRANELRRLGYHTKMESLQNQDKDLDVRERAKTAAYQLEHAIAY